MNSYRPMLAKEAPKPFSGKDWIFEVKWDGFRAIAYLNEKLSLKSRNGREMLFNFPELIELKQLATNVVVDGEILILINGKVDFEAMQERSQVKSALEVDRRMRKAPATFVVFDILEKDGNSLIQLPLIERKQILRASVKDGGHVVISDYIEEYGEAYFKAAADKGLEGIIAKRKNSSYQPGKRSDSWLKIKNLKTVDCVIFGYSKGAGYRESTFGSLVLGLYDRDSKPVYVGNVGTGFDQALLESLFEKLQTIESEDQDSPFTVLGFREDTITWTNPKLVCEVIFMAVTPGLKLRHPRFKRLRTDKLPSECMLSQIETN